mmetsp:Transcript_16263/g.25788  ORF Transcript_16263/g.25788 Transcript_16263/m.25788 type:complete len:233 (-) Transcript_16263:764-1462(-)
MRRIGVLKTAVVIQNLGDMTKAVVLSSHGGQTTATTIQSLEAVTGKAVARIVDGAERTTIVSQSRAAVKRTDMKRAIGLMAIEREGRGEGMIRMVDPTEVGEPMTITGRRKDDVEDTIKMVDGAQMTTIETRNQEKAGMIKIEDGTKMVGNRVTMINIIGTKTNRCRKANATKAVALVWRWETLLRESLRLQVPLLGYRQAITQKPIASRSRPKLLSIMAIIKLRWIYTRRS